MKDGIVETQNLPSIKRIVPVNQAHDVSIATVLMYAFVNVLKSLFINRVYDDLNLILGYLFLSYVLSNKVARFLWGMIVNVDDLVILIVLHKEGVQVSSI